MSGAAVGAAAPAVGSAAPAGSAPAAAGAADVPASGEAPKAEAPKPAPSRIKGKYKFEGKEAEYDYDEAGLQRDIQRLKHFEKTRGESDARVKAFEERMAALEKDPVAFFKQRNIDLTELARQQQAQQDELAKLSPEARRIRELEEQLAAGEREKMARAEHDKRTAAQQEHDTLVRKTAGTLDAALKLSGLPRSGELLKTYVEVQELAEHAGEPEMSPEQVVAAGERLMTKRLGDMLKAAQNEAWRTRNADALAELAKAAFAPLVGKLPQLSGEALFQMLGAPLVQSIAKAAFDHYRAGKAPIVQEPVRPAAAPPAAPNGRPAVTEWDVLDKFQAA